MKEAFNKVSKALGRDDYKGVDLRPMADEIVKKTLHRMDLAKQENSTQPTVLILGELHNNPTHRVLHMLVMNKLQEKKIDFLLGEEAPHSYIYDAFGKFTKNRNAGWNKDGVYLSDKIKKDDKDGHMALKVDMAMFTHVFSDLSLKTWYQFIIDNKIASKFNDASRGVPSKDKTVKISPDDKLTRHFIDKISPGSHSIETSLPKGMHIRNHIIVHNALSHAKTSKAELYVQICGASHVVGEGWSFRYNQSLAALFKKKSCPVMSVPYFGGGFDLFNMPEDAIKDLNTKEALWGISPYNRGFFGADNKKEKSFLKKTLRASGLDPSICDIDKNVKEYRKQTISMFKEWKKEYTPEKKPDNSLGARIRRLRLF